MSLPHIVVVEDEPAIRRGVTDALRISGYTVTEAADGDVGLNAALRRDVGSRTCLIFCCLAVMVWKSWPNCEKRGRTCPSSF